MISKNQVKRIRSLHQKKGRKEEQMFIAEGEKVVHELLQSGFEVTDLFATEDFLAGIMARDGLELFAVTQEELEKISALTTPNKALAVARIPQQGEIDYSQGLKIVLDEVGDPGNLGAILRIADWFAIDEVICSPGTVECFNPKVVQAAMGSLFRVKVHYSDILTVLSKNKTSSRLPVWGAVIDGKNIYGEKLPDHGFIILGNESSGINKELLSRVDHTLSIPPQRPGVESLNVAVAAGIICAEFRRQNPI